MTSNVIAERNVLSLVGETVAKLTFDEEISSDGKRTYNIGIIDSNEHTCYWNLPFSKNEAQTIFDAFDESAIKALSNIGLMGSIEAEFELFEALVGIGVSDSDALLILLLVKILHRSSPVSVDKYETGLKAAISYVKSGQMISFNRSKQQSTIEVFFLLGCLFGYEGALKMIETVKFSLEAQIDLLTDLKKMSSHVVYNDLDFFGTLTVSEIKLIIYVVSKDGFDLTNEGLYAIVYFLRLAGESVFKQILLSGFVRYDMARVIIARLCGKEFAETVKEIMINAGFADIELPLKGSAFLVAAQTYHETGDLNAAQVAALMMKDF